MEKEDIKLGMVFRWDSHSEIEYVVIGIYPDTVMLERITQRNLSGNRHGYGYGWFICASAQLVRIMNKKELSEYQTNDPICSLEKGVYKAQNTIDTLLQQGCILENNIVRITKFTWSSTIRKNNKLEIYYQLFGKEGTNRISYGSATKMACIHWFWENFKKANL